MSKTPQISKKEQIEKAKKLLVELKGMSDTQECVLRTTQKPSAELLRRLESIGGESIKIELLNKDDYIGGAEIIINGKIYSNLVKKQLVQVKTYLLENERSKKFN